MDIQRWMRRAYDAYCRKKNWQRIVRMLAVVVVFCTTYVLMLPAITLESKTICGYTEHLHSNQCFELREPPACTLPEIQGHSHTDECWQENSVLICGLEDHGHGDDCWQNSSTLICGLEDHDHGDDCWQNSSTLVCESEEHLHEDSCHEISRELVCDLEETPGHSHEEDSLEPVEVLICQLEEHNHTDACYPVEETEPKQQIHSEMDSTADLETEADWEAGLATVEMTGNWISDFVAVARSQLGYSESLRNYIYDENNVIRPYTRYGQWIGQPYGDWSASFVSFCLHYAQAEGLEAEQSCEALATAAKDAELWLDLEDYVPTSGDLIFLDRNDDGICDHVAIVEEQLSDEIAKAAAAVIPMREPAAIPEETSAETTSEETTGQTEAVTEPVTEAVTEAVTEPAPEVVYTGDAILQVVSGDVKGKVDRIPISLADAAVMGFARLPEDPEIPPAEPHVYEKEDGSLTQVQFAGDTSVPQDAELTVTEITAAEEGHAEMTRQVQELLGTEDASITLLDISFYDSEGEYLSVTDTAQVLMDLELEDPQQTTVRVFHFVDGVPVELEDIQLIQTAASTMALLEEEETQPLIQTQLMFETEGFSIFAVAKVTEPGVVEDATTSDLANLSGEYYIVRDDNGIYAMLATAAKTYNASYNGLAITQRINNVDELLNYTSWTFHQVTAGSAQYKIATQVDGVPKYIQLTSANWQAAHLYMTDTESAASVFTVTKKGNSVLIGTTQGTNTYYINPFGGVGTTTSFAGWYEDHGGSLLKLYAKNDLTAADLNGKSFAIVSNLDNNKAIGTGTVQVNDVPGLTSQQVITFTHDGQIRYSGDAPEWTFEASKTTGAYRVYTTDAEGNKKYLTFLTTLYWQSNSKGSLTLEDLNETNTNQDIYVVPNEDGTVYLTVRNGETISYINLDNNTRNFWVFDQSHENNKLLLCEKTDESLLNYNLRSPASSGWFTSNAPYLSQTRQIVPAEGTQLYSVANKNAVGSFVYNSLPSKTDVLAYYNTYNAGLGTNLNADTYKAPGSEWRFLGWQATVDGSSYLFPEGADAIPQADGVHIVDVDGVERVLPSDTTLTGQWKKISDVVMFFVNFYDTMLDKQQKKVISKYDSDYYTQVVAIGRLFNAIEIEPDGKTNTFNGWINIQNHEQIQGELRQQYNPNENEETTQLVIDAVAEWNETTSQFEFKTAKNLNQGMLEAKITSYLQNNPDANTGIKLDKAHVDKSEITADNYQLYWYLQKGVGGDGWHIDGVLVAKTQPMEIYKTFSGLTREEAESAIEQMTFPLHLIHTTGNQDVKDPYIDLEASKDLDGVYKRYGWQSTTSNIYKWTLNSVQGQRYTFEEEGYLVAGHDVSSLVSVHYKDGDVVHQYKKDATYTDTGSTTGGTGTDGSTPQPITDLYANKPLIGGEVESIIFANFYTETGTGAFSISKVADEAGRVRLSGAKFTLTGPNNYSVTKVTNENGAASFEDLAPGTYILKETDAPAGYQEQPDMDWTVTVTQVTPTDETPYSVVTILPKDGTEAVTLYNGNQGGMQKVYLIQNEPVTTMVTVKKRFTNISNANLETLKADYQIAVTDAVGNPIMVDEKPIVLKLNNATESMGVYTWSIDLPGVNETYKFVESNFYHQAYIDAAVTATVVNWEMVDGELTAVEKPAEVTKTFADGIPVTASISMVKSDRADTVSFTNNYIDTFQLQILKVNASSANHDPIQGVIFNIYGEYKDAQGTETFTYTDENGKVHILQQQNKEPLVTDANGKVSFDNMKLSSTAQNKEFLYVIKETKAPDGYLELDEPIVKTVRINDGDPNYANGVYTLTVENWTPDLAPVTVVANKRWNIPEDMDKSPITLHLYQGIAGENTVTKLQTITVDADGNAVDVVESALEEHQSVTAKDWTITWTGLRYHDNATQKLYEYYISEDPIPAHSTTYSTTVSTMNVGQTQQTLMAKAVGYEQKRSTTITNTSGYALPSTGGSGNRWYAPLGLLLILAGTAGYWLSDNKKKASGE